MAIRNKTQLESDISGNVKSGGTPSKTTAADLRTVFTNLVDTVFNFFASANTWTGVNDFTGTLKYKGTDLDQKYASLSTNPPPTESTAQQGVVWSTPPTVSVSGGTAIISAFTPTVNGTERNVTQATPTFVYPADGFHYRVFVILNFADPAAPYSTLKLGDTAATTAPAVAPTLSDTTEKYISQFVVRSDGAVVPPPSAELQENVTQTGQNGVKSSGIWSFVTNALGGKQNTLTFDSAPTAASTNPVESGGVKTYVDNIYTPQLDYNQFDLTCEVAFVGKVVIESVTNIRNCTGFSYALFTPSNETLGAARTTLTDINADIAALAEGAVYEVHITIPPLAQGKDFAKAILRAVKL
ncbi:hypothetical protein [Rufibacter roseus]|uniref:Baseplate protein J-like domain-containing protein n=1 Tax=Rufibacter roseus TaxID=1567108 RepID=A0ABW2DJN3_9BACT|nr:hypothetical protein [Rufibacter roseus]